MYDRYKYRIWLSDKRKIYSVHSIHFGTNKAVISSTHGNVTVPLRGNILMQCIGIKDKNNKPIYEGDILRVKIGEYRIINVYVKWDKQKYRLISQKGYGMSQVASLKDLTSSEVIGNIYEDSILLKGGD